MKSTLFKLTALSFLVSSTALFAASKEIAPSDDGKSPPSKKLPETNITSSTVKKFLPVTATESGAVVKEEDWRDNRWNQMEVGQFVSSSLTTPNGTILKGLSIKVGESDEAAVCYDTRLVNLRAAWMGKFLQFDPARFGLIKTPVIAGDLKLSTSAESGWIGSKPVYRGLYLNGKRVVLSYQLGDTSVLESPWFESMNGVSAFTRAIEVGAGKSAQKLTLAGWGGSESTTVNGQRLVVMENGGLVLAIAAVGNAEPVLTVKEGSVVVELPPRTRSSSCKLFVAQFGKSDLEKFATLVKNHSAPENLHDLAQVGSPRWTEIVKTRGQLGLANEPYVVDTIPVPYDNRYKALMFLSGVDFFENGDAAVCSIHGDVWVVSGIDEKLEKVTWKRFATGLFQPLGLKIVNNEVHVLGRDQITILHDQNHDGEADFYENFCNEIKTSQDGHDYVTCLETNSSGDFFYVDPLGLHRVSSDGCQHETLATGWRNPNGLSVSPDGVITVTPQEGNWTPSSAIFEVKGGGYYGFDGPQIALGRPLGYDAPLCWIPHTVDNSTASQVWVSSDKWGPLKGQMLNLSFGRSSMMLVLREVVDGQSQGGVVVMKPRFLAGAMRGTFRRLDGQLYVVGSNGWQTSGTRDGSFQRVRYTGKNINLPVGLKVRGNGIQITFSESLDRATAEDVGSFGIEQWNYIYSKDYGSKEYSVNSPKEVGHDAVEVKSARLLPDTHSVFLEIPRLQPVMQMRIQYNVNSSQGNSLRGEIFNTINRLGKREAALQAVQ